MFQNDVKFNTNFSQAKLLNDLKEAWDVFRYKLGYK